MPEPADTRYRTTNWSDYNASLKRRGSLSVWFDPEMSWQAERAVKRGHPETFSDSAIQTCLTLKVLFGLPLRQSEPVRRHWSEPTGERSGGERD